MQTWRVAKACEHSSFRPTYKAHSDQSAPVTRQHILHWVGLLQRGVTMQGTHAKSCKGQGARELHSQEEEAMAVAKCGGIHCA